MISSKTKYGLQALILLAKEYNKRPLLITEISEKEYIPKKFLESILLELKNKGYLAAKKGRGGGYRLIKPPKDIIVGDVIRILNGPLAPTSCSSKTAYAPCPECKDVKKCKIRKLMIEVREAIANVLDSETLADLVKK